MSLSQFQLRFEVISDLIKVVETLNYDHLPPWHKIGGRRTRLPAVGNAYDHHKLEPASSGRRLEILSSVLDRLLVAENRVGLPFQQLLSFKDDLYSFYDVRISFNLVG